MNQQPTTFTSKSFKSENVKPTSFTSEIKDEPIQKQYIFIRQGRDEQADLDFSKPKAQDKSLANSAVNSFSFLVDTIASGLRWIMIISMLYVGVPYAISATTYIVEQTFSSQKEFLQAPATEHVKQLVRIGATVRSLGQTEKHTTNNNGDEK